MMDEDLDDVSADCSGRIGMEHDFATAGSSCGHHGLAADEEDETDDDGANGLVAENGIVAENGLVADEEDERDGGGPNGFVADSDDVDDVELQPSGLADLFVDDSDSNSDFQSEGDLEMAPSIVEGAPRANDLTFSFTWAKRLFMVVKGIFGEDLILQRLCTHTRLISSHFSGLGTAELAINMLLPACDRVMRSKLLLRPAFACDISSGCRAVLQERLNGACVHKDLWDRFPGFDIGSHIHGGTLDYDSACKAIMSRCDNLARGAPCVTHMASCTCRHIDGEVAGSPCIAWSRASTTRQGRKHPVTGLLLAWCAWVLFSRPRVAIHENVVGFDTNILEEVLGVHYFIQHIRAAPSHMGFPFICRPRTYSVLILRTALRRSSLQCPLGIQEAYERIVAAMNYQAVDSVDWLWRASDTQLLEEENRVRAKRGLAPLSRHTIDWTYLLTPKQRERLAHHVQVSRGTIWDLTQSVRFATHSSKKVPTLRRGSTRLWSQAKKRWLLRIELRAAMGYPVFQDLADVANVPRESAEMMGPVFATGNAMHVANVGCITLLGWLYVD